MDNNILSKENGKIVLLNLLATIIWYSFAYIIKILLEIIKGYTMPPYVTHIGFVLVVLSLNIWFSLYFRQRANKKINAPKVPNRPTTDKFIVAEGPGWLTNPRTNEIFCLSCWYNNQAKIHLIKTKGVPIGWTCPKCNKPYTSFSRMLEYYFRRK